MRSLDLFKSYLDYKITDYFEPVEYIIDVMVINDVYDGWLGMTEHRDAAIRIWLNKRLMAEVGISLHEVIAHELIHVQQILDGRLKVIDDTTVVFENTVVDLKDVEDLPAWEQEAYGLSCFIERDLRKDYPNLEDLLKF